MTISCQLQASGDSWKVVVQLEEHDWILADAIINLSFVILEEDICSHCYDDCRGMCNFFVCSSIDLLGTGVSRQYRGICVLPFQEEWKVFVSTGLSITLNSSSIAYDRLDVLCKNYCVALLSHKKVTFHLAMSNFNCQAAADIISKRKWKREVLQPFPM